MDNQNQPISPGESGDIKIETEEQVQVKDRIEVEEKEEPEEQKNEYKEFFYDNSGPLELQPVYTSTVAALGLATNDAERDQVAVSDVGRLAATLLQSDNPEEIFNFLAKRLTEMPSNISNPVFYLQKKLFFEYEAFKRKQNERR